MPSNQDRIFQGKSTFPEHEEWFYRAREGVAGPYLRREDAVFALNRFIEYCQKNHLTGGRQAPGIDSANKKAPNVWLWLVASLEQAAPMATWLLGVLFGRMTG